MAALSNFFLNGMIAETGASAAVAGIGIVRKIDSFAYAINQGIAQGMLPIVAYCYATRRISRMKAVGESVKPFLLSLLHKGSLDIILFFVIRRLWGSEYILWASPVMAAVALLTALILVVRLFHRGGLSEELIHQR